MLLLLCVLNMYHAFVIMCTQYILCFCYYVYSIYIMLLLLCVLNIYYAFVIMCTQYILCFHYYVYSIYGCCCAKLYESLTFDGLNFQVLLTKIGSH